MHSDVLSFSLGKTYTHVGQPAIHYTTWNSNPLPPESSDPRSYVATDRAASVMDVTVMM
jgi:hypothetical protein